jgi:8-oxo-dGTP diphosphatase
MTQLALINPRGVTDEEARGYSLRTAMRAIVLDNENNIALLHVTKRGYYKLPGGGVDEGEDTMKALKRECKEEIGCDIEIVGEVGTTVEYWKEDVEKQTSHCFIAKLVGEKGTPQLTEGEKEKGFETVWVPYDKARALLESSARDDWEAEYIVPRELLFLEAARK